MFRRKGPLDEPGSQWEMTTDRKEKKWPEAHTNERERESSTGKAKADGKDE